MVRIFRIFFMMNLFYYIRENKFRDITLAYTSKGCTPIEVLPVPNAYTTSEQTTGVFCFFYVLLRNVVYALGTGRTSTGIHPFDV